MKVTTKIYFLMFIRTMYRVSQQVLDRNLAQNLQYDEFLDGKAISLQWSFPCLKLVRTPGSSSSAEW